MSKSKSTATLLAFFGGALGLHKFYLGETGKGIMYIFLSYMLLGLFRIPITVFLGIIDAIKLTSMSNEEFQDKYASRTREERRAYRRSRNQNRDSSGNYRDDNRRYKYQAKRQRKNPFKISGKKKFDDYDLEEALKDFDQALVIEPDDPEIHINLAAIYSLLEKKQKAYDHIKTAINKGWKKTDEILTRDEFAYIRIQPDFEVFKSSGFLSSEQASLSAPKGDLLQDDLLLSQLNKLKNLREKGLLSEKEFLLEKEKLFNK